MKRVHLIAAALLAAAATTAPASAAPADLMTPAGPVHTSAARGPLRPVDFAPFKGRSSSEVLAGPASGLDSSWVIYTRLAPRAAPLGSISLPVDHTYLVLKGQANVEIGNERFVIKPETMVLLPAGTPHRIWNASGEEADVFEVITPAPQRDLAGLIRPAAPRRVPNAASLVRVAPPLGELAGGTGHASLNERILASRATGSLNVLERLNDMLPGGGRTETHLHPFDQVYFVRKGEMAVIYGMKTYVAKANTLVVLPVGVVHNNTNASNSVQSIVTLLLPEPEKGQPLGQGVTLSGSAAAAAPQRGAAQP
ncbi:cupin domain-containing protein [Novosphingobium flavum]|uniref:Cupin domain-containing protein n=1 Tax=Novosphingobium flavum TaxID=1778672 RepID=A0A7X1KLF1_9SPHN|nr:cupin domain-containing protein [Novosphingobium flavum]MBC2665519.1 cupin domain-containing protein [Novosphingobium flavum]